MKIFALLTALTVMASQVVVADNLTIDGNTSVDLAFASNTYEAQQICDDEDLACITEADDCYYIGDHSHQAFTRLSEVRVGDTATFTLNGETRELECVLVDVNGYITNTSPYLHFSGGQVPYQVFEDAVICYTCAYAFNGNRIIVVFQ